MAQSLWLSLFPTLLKCHNIVAACWAVTTPWNVLAMKQTINFEQLVIYFGSVLRLARTICSLYSHTTNDEANYIIVRISKPVTTLSVSAIDLAKTLPVASLYHLIHVRLGCPGQQAMELLLNGRSMTGLPTNNPIPDAFFCPICLREKQPSLPHGPSCESPFQVLGELLHLDFGFYHCLYSILLWFSRILCSHYYSYIYQGLYQSGSLSILQHLSCWHKQRLSEHSCTS